MLGFKRGVIVGRQELLEQKLVGMITVRAGIRLWPATRDTLIETMAAKGKLREAKPFEPTFWASNSWVSPCDLGNRETYLHILGV